MNYPLNVVFYIIGRQTPSTKMSDIQTDPFIICGKSGAGRGFTAFAILDTSLFRLMSGDETASFPAPGLFQRKMRWYRINNQ